MDEFVIHTTTAPPDCSWLWDGVQWIAFEQASAYPPCWPPDTIGACLGDTAVTSRGTPAPGNK
jgi:hypothetical protein